MSLAKKLLAIRSESDRFKFLLVLYSRLNFGAFYKVSFVVQL